MTGYHLTDAEANMAAALAMLEGRPDGHFADYAEHLLRKALPAEPRLQPVLATLAVGMQRGNVAEAAALLAPLLPQPPGVA